MGYIKQNCCADLSLQEFREQWGQMSAEDQEELREWARAEGAKDGVEIE